MDRRQFLKTIARLLGLAALPTRGRAAPRPHLIQRCPLAGFQHHDGPELWPYLTVGDSLQLVREPANPFDPNAIRIYWNGRRLGYVPRAENAATARLLDQGFRLEARIGRLVKHDNPWRRVAVEVWRVG
jgi:hypothetical protein